MLDIKEAISKIVMIRTVEEIIRQEFFNQKIFSFLHLMIGQEASPVGVAMALSDSDIVLGNHRSHGHILAKGGSLKKMVCEIFGDPRGSCGGFGGSMHMLDRDVGFEGSTPILGSISSIATGRAFSQKFLKQDGITVCFLGDGAAEEGVFVESVNLAAAKELPIVFVIEDNKYAVNSRHSDRKSSQYSFQSVFEGIGAGYIRKDGQRVDLVFEGMKNAKSVADLGKPCVLHLDVVRSHGHSGPMVEETDQEYREADDGIEDRKARDPIMLSTKYAEEEYGIPKSEIEALIERVESAASLEMKQILGEINVRY